MHEITQGLYMSLNTYFFSVYIFIFYITAGTYCWSLPIYSSINLLLFALLGVVCQQPN